MHSFLFLFPIFLNNIYCQRLISPCPRFFKYESSNPTESDQWYGVVTLLSENDLQGVWLRLIFDNPSIQLGNWFGQVNTEDNVEYLIKNRSFKLKKNTPKTIRFYVKYDENGDIPRLKGMRLNAKSFCPDTNSEIATTTTETITTTQQYLKTIFEQSVDSSSPPSDIEEEDYFHGDFSSSFNLRNPPTSENTCGTIVKSAAPLITRGFKTNVGEFPWHAALYHSKKMDLTYVCGGSLVSSSYLITAAHCVTRWRKKIVLPASHLIVYLGKFLLKDWTNIGIQDKHVDQIFVHPEYNPERFANDIAMVKFITPAEITDYVRPVCLWTGPDSVINQTGTIIGWGFDETGKLSEELQKAQMPVVSLETCIYSYPQFYARFTSQKTICAGYRNGTSACNGDSGSGLVFSKAGSNPDNPVWQLRAIVSLSVAMQNNFVCDTSHYVVFTDVAKYSDWVQKIISQPLSLNII